MAATRTVLTNGSNSSSGFNSAQSLSAAIQAYGHVTVSSGDYALSIARNNPDTFSISDGGGGSYIIGFAGAVQNWTGIRLPGQYTPPSGGVKFDANLQRVQQMLNQFPSSQPRIKTDGFWGAQTIARLTEFQRQYGLPVTGHWDQATINRLQAGNVSSSRASNNVLSTIAAPSNNQPLNSKPPNPSANNNSEYLLIGAALVGLALLSKN